MPGGKYYEKELLQAYKEGRLKEQGLRRCCANVVNSIVQSAVYEEVKNALKY